MAKKSKEDFRYEIKEVLGIASPQEDLKGDFVKAVLTSLMSGEKDEMIEGVDIRGYNAGTGRTYKGIRLSIQEAHNVCDILLQHGYGSMDVLEAEYNKRKGMFSGGGEE